MRLKWTLLLAAGLLVGCANGKHEEGNEVKMDLDQVPAAARATLMREAGGAKITKVDKEMSGGKVVYETDVMMNGKNWEIKVDEAGNVVSKKLDEESEEKEEKKK